MFIIDRNQTLLDKKGMQPTGGDAYAWLISTTKQHEAACIVKNGDNLSRNNDYFQNKNLDMNVGPKIKKEVLKWNCSLD